MSQFEWGTNTAGFGLNGDWDTATLWAGSIVPTASAAVLIDAPGLYSVTIGAAETVVVNTLTLTGEAQDFIVDGTLEFAGLFPSDEPPLGNIPLVIGFNGEVDGVGRFSASSLLNLGRIDANAASDDFLEVLNTVTNDGTLIADNGNLFILSLGNLQNGTLSGGEYIAQGFIPANATSYALNTVQIGETNTVGITTDAATIVLDGPASLFELDEQPGGNTQTLEQTLGSVAAGAALALLDGYDYTGTLALTNAGLVTLGGGTLETGGLTIGSTGTLIGYGSVVGSLVNDGAIIADGGPLGTMQLTVPVTGGGTLEVTAGSELVMPGATVVSLIDDGVIYASGPVDVTGSLAGSGTILIEQGELALAQGSSATLAFAGSGVTIALDAPAQFHGVVSGFEQGDTLLLKGIGATSGTIVNGNTLALMSGATTVDTVTLAGNYAGATFNVSNAGGTTAVTSLSGAPARDDMQIATIDVTNTIGLADSLVVAIENDLSFAVSEWGQYIVGATGLRVSLDFVSGGNFGGELAEGSPGGFVPTGQTIDGHPIYIPDSLYALETGNHTTGFSSDLAITIVASPANLQNFYINPDPEAGTAVPSDKYDLISVLEHEIGHGLGFIGLIDRLAPTQGEPPIDAGSAADTYDMLVSYGSSGATFTGTDAEAVYGNMIGAGSAVPVPLYFTTDSGLTTENFYHVASTVGDLMNVALSPGTFIPVSNLDLAILKDTGVPVTSDVPCFVRGTRIRTPDGEVAIETLRVGANVVTLSGAIRPIVWIGQRDVDCTRHPRPDRVYPVRIAAGAFGGGRPSRDLWISANHAVFFEGVLIPARLLVDGAAVASVPCARVTYFHLELESHDVVFAEGLATETYLECGDRGNFSYGDAAIRLYADFASDAPAEVWDARGYAPLCLSGEPIARARAVLARVGRCASSVRDAV
jgi:hypothetical protein